MGLTETCRCEAFAWFTNGSACSARVGCFCCIGGQNALRLRQGRGVAAMRADQGLWRGVSCGYNRTRMHCYAFV